MPCLTYTIAFHTWNNNPQSKQIHALLIQFISFTGICIAQKSHSWSNFFAGVTFHFVAKACNTSASNLII